MGTRFYLLNAFVQGFFCHTNQTCRVGRNSANRDRDAGIAVKPLKVSTRVYLQHITRADYFFTTGDAMHHFVIDG
jgi:hypothetical protein